MEEVRTETKPGTPPMTEDQKKFVDETIGKVVEKMTAQLGPPQAQPTEADMVAWRTMMGRIINIEKMVVDIGNASAVINSNISNLHKKIVNKKFFVEEKQVVEPHGRKK